MWRFSRLKMLMLMWRLIRLETCQIFSRWEQKAEHSRVLACSIIHIFVCVSLVAYYTPTIVQHLKQCQKARWSTRCIIVDFYIPIPIVCIKSYQVCDSWAATFVLSRDSIHHQQASSEKARQSQRCTRGNLWRLPWQNHQCLANWQFTGDKLMGEILQSNVLPPPSCLRPLACMVTLIPCFTTFSLTICLSNITPLTFDNTLPNATAMLYVICYVLAAMYQRASTSPAYSEPSTLPPRIGIGARVERKLIHIQQHLYTPVEHTLQQLGLGIADNKICIMPKMSQ